MFLYYFDIASSQVHSLKNAIQILPLLSQSNGFPNFLQGLVFNRLSDLIDLSLHLSSLLRRPVIVDNWFNFVNVPWFHSKSVLFVIYHNLCLWSEICNIWLSLCRLPKMACIWFIHRFISQFFLFMVRLLNDSFWLGRFASSLDIVHDLSSHIVWEEGLFINTFIRK